MKTFIVAYRLPLLSRAWNTLRCEAESPSEAVRMCCMEIPSANIEDVWEINELGIIPDENKHNKEQI